MTISLKAAKGVFFDRKAVIAKIGKEKVKVLGRQGALVRKIARNSMKKKKGAAAAGMPPNAHEGSLKKLLYFAWDNATASVFVGPVKLGKGTAPGIQERGGKVPVKGFINRSGKFVPLRLLPPAVKQRIIASGKVVTEIRTIAARPYMKPALAKSKPMLAKEWKGSIKK